MQSAVIFVFWCQQTAADLAVEEAEHQRHVEQEKEREKELMKLHSKDKRNKKEGGRRSKSKSGTSPGKNAVPDTPTPGMIVFAHIHIVVSKFSVPI